MTAGIVCIVRRAPATRPFVRVGARACFRCAVCMATFLDPAQRIAGARGWSCEIPVKDVALMRRPGPAA